MWFVETVCLDMQMEDDPAVCCMEPLFVKNSEEMKQLIIDKKVDFAFPIQVDVKEALEDIPYVTLVRAFVSMGCSLIVNINQCKAESREQLLASIMSQWPILAVITLLSGIAGVVIWLLEHKTNKNQFSSSFTAGSPEGFWWAVVSLTTVGYGDKTPKTFLGRLFGVVWILVGAIMLSLFTALFTNAMQAALDGTKCQDIDSKEVGVPATNTEAQMVAKEFDAKIIKFDDIKELQKNLNSGQIGRVLVDRNTAFHFLDKSGLKRNRQIRLIREIDYPMDYYMVHVRRGNGPSSPKEDLDDMPMSLNGSDVDSGDSLSSDELEEQRRKVTTCGPLLKQLSNDLVGASKTTAEEQVIQAELQTASLSDELEGLFSTGSQMTSFILFSLLGIFLSLIFLGILWELYIRCNASRVLKRNGSPSLRGHSEKGNLIPFNKRFSMMQNFLDMEERLRELTADLQKMKEEFASTIANGDATKGHYQQWSNDIDDANGKQSFFDLLNGKSKHPETVL